MAGTAPTLVATYVAGPTAVSPVNVAVTVGAGDVLVLLAVTSDSLRTLGTPTGGSGINWTLRQSSVVTNWGNAYLWTATAPSAQSFTLSVPASGGNAGAQEVQYRLYRYSGSDGIGATAIAHGSGTPSLGIATQQANSALPWINVDWNVVNGSGRAYLAVNGSGPVEDGYALTTSAAYYNAHHNNAGAVGAKTVGLSAPTGQQWTTAAAEVLGHTDYTASAADMAAGTDAATIAVTKGVADTAAGADAATATQGLVRSPADAAAGTDAVAVEQGRAASDTAATADAATAELTKGAFDTAAAAETVAYVQKLVRAPADRADAADHVVVDFHHAEIRDYQFVIPMEPWVPFGIGQTVVVEKFDPGTSDSRNQDVLGATSDTRLFGRDLKTPPTWAFDLYTDVRTPADALAWAQNMQEVWEADEVRATTNAVVPLRYAVGGRIRRVYGRPRNFDIAGTSTLHTGKLNLVCDFALAEHVYYDDAEQGVEVHILANNAGGGFTFPVTFPLTMDPSSDPRVEQMVVGGRKPTWVDVTFYGPVVDPYVLIGPYRWGLRGNVPQDRSVRLSGKPWQMGVYQDDGQWLPGMLDPRARLSQLRVPPGTYSVQYGGRDNTGTSRAVLAWRNAYGTM